ncbi:hypothetical protein [Sorangium sp. So ce1182]|uniref:hypothetical protein n=1 Tax=Sorangium sp. So ce1182 TaxID=3133334 RepID=UPI003F5FE38A
MRNASQPANGEPWRPGVPQPMMSPPGEQPGTPGSPGHTSPDREIQLPGTTPERPGGDPGKHQPEVPAPAHTHEVPDPSPYEVPRHDFPRAQGGP